MRFDHFKLSERIYASRQKDHFNIYLDEFLGSGAATSLEDVVAFVNFSLAAQHSVKKDIAKKIAAHSIEKIETDFPDVFSEANNSGDNPLSPLVKIRSFYSSNFAQEATIKIFARAAANNLFTTDQFFDFVTETFASSGDPEAGHAVKALCHTYLENNEQLEDRDKNNIMNFEKELEDKTRELLEQGREGGSNLGADAQSEGELAESEENDGASSPSLSSSSSGRSNFRGLDSEEESEEAPSPSPSPSEAEESTGITRQTGRD